MLAEYFGVFGAGAAHMRQRGLVADAFLHCVGDEVRVFFEQFPLIGELVECMNDARHGVAGRVVPTNDQENQVAHEFLRTHLVHRI